MRWHWIDLYSTCKEHHIESQKHRNPTTTNNMWEGKECERRYCGSRWRMYKVVCHGLGLLKDRLFNIRALKRKNPTLKKSCSAGQPRSRNSSCNAFIQSEQVWRIGDLSGAILKPVMTWGALSRPWQRCMSSRTSRRFYVFLRVLIGSRYRLGFFWLARCEQRLISVSRHPSIIKQP